MNIFLDYDGTLAKQEGNYSEVALDPSAPVPRMVARAKKWISDGHSVTIFTASIFPLGTLEKLSAPESMVDHARNRKKVIEAFCVKHLGQKLPVTCIKSMHADVFYDDKAVQVDFNKGTLTCDSASTTFVKIDKTNAGYVEQQNTDFRCSDCWKWIPATRQCAELRPDDLAKKNGYCIMWSYGSPPGGLKPTGAYTPEEVGYGEKADGTRCTKCEYYDDHYCERVKGSIAGDTSCCDLHDP